MKLMKDVVFLGGVGVGKTTQAEILQESCSHAKILSNQVPFQQKECVHIFDNIDTEVLSTMEHISGEVFFLQRNPLKLSEIQKQHQEKISKILRENTIDYTTITRIEGHGKYNEIMQTHFKILGILWNSGHIDLRLPVNTFNEQRNRDL